ncbi:MAG: hypothetical protein DRP50_03145 [Thermotoga sp.]|nr:helix-turn-helix domain-containing protein [Thermotogota bacterium]RKX55281.1 MAG: hypothetical protein DRP50_03145 [Thermotoga sp.]
MLRGDRLRKLRKKKGYSQESLAHILGVTRQNISAYELGEADPPVSKLILLARALGTTTDYLLGLDDVKEKGRKIVESFLESQIDELRKKYPDLIIGAAHGKGTHTQKLIYAFLTLLDITGEIRDDTYMRTVVDILSDLPEDITEMDRKAISALTKYISQKRSNENTSGINY